MILTEFSNINYKKTQSSWIVLISPAGCYLKSLSLQSAPPPRPMSALINILPMLK